MSEQSVTKAQSFEESYAELEKIVLKLEKESVDLDEALKLFQKGQQLVKTCSSLLENAAIQIEEIQKGKQE